MITSNLTTADNALVVVDMQKVFVLPDSPMCIAGAYATLPAIARMLDYARSHGWAVVYALRLHRPSGIDTELFRRHFFEEGHPFCVPGTPGAEVADEIKPQPGDITISKHRFSAFFASDLDLVLRGLGVKHVYIAGTQYPNCIRSTAVDSMSLDYPTTVLTDCCSAASPEVAESNIRDIRAMGIDCIDSTEVMK
jgi:nicotinamidase-related amidase